MEVLAPEERLLARQRRLRPFGHHHSGDLPPEPYQAPATTVERVPEFRQRQRARAVPSDAHYT